MTDLYPEIEPYEQGFFDFQAPIGNAWELKRVWPRAELVIVDNAGHAPDIADTTQELIRATDRFAFFP